MDDSGDADVLSIVLSPPTCDLSNLPSPPTCDPNVHSPPTCDLNVHSPPTCDLNVHSPPTCDLSIVLSPSTCYQCTDRDVHIKQLTEELNTTRAKLDSSKIEQESTRTELEKSKTELQGVQKLFEQTKTDLDNNEIKLQRLQSLFERGTKFAEEFLMEIVILNKEVEDWKARARGNVERVDVAVQTSRELHGDVSTQELTDVNSKDTVTDHVDGEGVPLVPEDAAMVPEDEPEEGEIAQEESISVVDGLREAAQAAQQQTGFVYDKETGLYFDQNSGYYYDAEKSLYYEPYSCTYYYYNTETSSYEFHSQADLSKLSEEAQARYKQNITGDKPKKKKKKDKDADPDDKGIDKVSKRKKRDRKSDGDDTEPRRRRRKRDHISSDGTKSNEIVGKAHLKHHKKHSKQSTEEKYREHSTKREDGKHKKGMDNEIWDDAIMAPGMGNNENHDRKPMPVKISEQCSKDSPDTICVSSDSDNGDVQTSGSVSGHESGSSGSSDVDIIKERSALSYPPCIRMIVTESEKLDVGNLYIIPYTGGTIGREPNLNHTVVVPDDSISKMHCSIQYNDEEKYYEVKDHASQNGTFINTCRLSETHVISEPYFVSHMDILQLGSNTFQLHIHPGNQTCEDCEPGLVQAKHKASAPQPEQPPVALEGKLDKEKRRRREMKQIRKKYGLAGAPYIDAAVDTTGYEDRSATRRITKGSDNPHQKDDAPSSVHMAISTENKGRKMLAKMGWKEGDSLGKSQEGITEPIIAHLRANKAAGLGSSLGYKQSIDNIGKIKLTERWAKTRDRYNLLEKLQGQVSTGQVSGSGLGQVSGSGLGQVSGSGQKGKHMQFVQGDTELFDKMELEPKVADMDIGREETVTSKSMKIKWSKGEAVKTVASKVTVGDDVNLAFAPESDSDEHG